MLGKHNFSSAKQISVLVEPEMRKCEWIWIHDHKDAFKEIKDAVKKKAPELKYFRKGNPT